ncbi:hypothetical protein [Lactobacillus crispatus]|uniref:hypothetical protein n=1 Tax=Lactobacillus crispatus TaxID=47770 RepID=UPI000B5DAF65|nr:hypothetical protein [Lactobacillus crispatus]OXC15475.1 hypothetical protein AYP78_04340 [Lactobacillus crispatus]OXC16710.1 hypothetical protein AYP79_08790 [Lactobacillus crispatus]OXC16980.1 hypothetical protein AYP80_03225 [Lactobacillus crispatus]OXC26300.1 hypothetical protein AYP84_01005 [Lactobacillus crispatus]
MTDQIDFLNNLTDVHAGQYLALNDGGSLKIVQVQESGVNDSYNLEPVDIENVDLDLSADYDLLQQLVASASSQKLDLSTLIINQLRSYPDQVKRLEDAKNELSVANQKVTDQEKAILDLQNEKQELEQEINELKKEISQKQDETKKTEETATQDSSSGQTQASPAANEKVSDTQGSSNEVIKPTE